MALLNEKEEEEDAEKALKGEFIEVEPAGLVSGVKIKHLAKVSRVAHAQLFAVALLNIKKHTGSGCASGSIGSTWVKLPGLFW